MGAGHIIVGGLWVACTGGLLAAGATQNVAAAAAFGFIGAAVLSLPVAFIVGGLWRLALAIGWTRRHRRGR